RAREIRLRQVPDVVVLRDDEALPLTRVVANDLPVDLQDYGSALETELGRVRVRELDQRPVSIGRDVTEPPPVPARREIRDDIELLSRIGKCLLERSVVARGHDQLMRNAAVPQYRG